MVPGMKAAGMPPCAMVRPCGSWTNGDGERVRAVDQSAHEVVRIDLPPSSSILEDLSRTMPRSISIDEKRGLGHLGEERVAAASESRQRRFIVP
jgi:hypothetical protein